MKEQLNPDQGRERGMALLTTLLMSTILLALGMAIVFSATSDTVITKSQRLGEQSFFAADAGVAIARRALAEALQEEVEKIQSGASPFFDSVDENPVSGQFPIVQAVPDPVANPTHPFYVNAKKRAQELARVVARDQILKDLNGAEFDVTFLPMSGSVTLQRQSGVTDRATEIVRLRYGIQVTGRTDAGGSASLIETGFISMNINLVDNSVTNPSRDFAFSGFGTFYDDGDAIAGAALASGIYTGPVHTNTHLAFRSTNNVTFRNVVSQVDDYIRYQTNGSWQDRSIPSADITGIDISAEGYKRVSHVPLPDNNFSQEYAVINGTGIIDRGADGQPLDPPDTIPTDNQGDPIDVFDASGRVTASVLKANLRDASNNEPGISGGEIENGVYIASGDGSTITRGAGIYVKGSASDIKLYAIGTDQFYEIRQGNSTTTVRVSPSANQTTISKGNNSKTFTGIPLDRSDPNNVRPGVSLFVDGSIHSLRGGKDGSTTRRALAGGTRLTITAQRHITITGDIKYTDPVVDSFGNPVSNIASVQNVLGIFTNDGNIYTQPDAQYVGGPGLSMELSGAVAAFNANKSNDNGVVEGSFTYKSGNKDPGNNDVFVLAGSRVQSKANLTNYRKVNRFFDVRFSGGKFAPPFYPGTTYSLSDETTTAGVGISVIDDPRATGMTWFRENK
jgi:hypothetical protein